MECNACEPGSRGLHLDRQALACRLVELCASALVPAPPERVFAFLRSLDRHWGLIDGRAVPLRVQNGGDGYVLRLRGPLGIRRTVRTRIITAQPPSLLVGRAEAGRRSRAFLSWSIKPSRGASRVVLVLRTESVGVGDRLLLLAGGRWWLARTLRVAVRTLASRVALEPDGRPDLYALANRPDPIQPFGPPVPGGTKK